MVWIYWFARLLLLDYGAGADVGLIVLLVFYFAIRVLFGLMFGWVVLGVLGVLYAVFAVCWLCCYCVRLLLGC